jgi:tight adherence protein B
MKTFIVALAFLIITILGLIPFLRGLEKQKLVAKLKIYDTRATMADDENDTPKWSLRNWVLDHMNSKAKSATRTERLAEDLYWAEIKLRPEEYRLMKLMLVLVFFLVYLITRDFFLSLVVLALILILPDMVLRFRKNRNMKILDEQIYYSIGVISGSLQAGHSLLQSLKIVAADIEDPLKREYSRIIKEINLGLPIQFTLTQAKERIKSIDFSLFVNAVLIQLKTGGNLSEILDRISHTIRERQKLANELNTLTAQGRLSGMIIVLLPVGLGLFMYIANREHIMLLFTTTIGRMLLGMAIIGQAIGIYFIKKIIAIGTL